MKNFKEKILRNILKLLGMNQVGFGGTWTLTHRNSYGEVVSTEHNIVPTEGLNLFNNILFGGTAKQTFYGLLTTGTGTPMLSSTLPTYLASNPEFTGYSESVRPTYTATITGANVTNTAAKMTFTINASGTVRGVMLATNNVKGSTTGVAASILLLGSAKTVASGDSLTLEYNFQAYSDS